MRDLARRVCEAVAATVAVRAQRPAPADQLALSFGLLKIRNTVASAKIFTQGFDDYLYLAKQNDRWRVVNHLAR